VPQCDDLDVALIAGREHPSGTADDQVTEGRDELIGDRPNGDVEQVETR
jgi:hypothetical protein